MPAPLCSTLVAHLATCLVRACDCRLDFVLGHCVLWHCRRLATARAGCGVLGQINLVGANALEVLEERACAGAWGGYLDGALSVLREVEERKNSEKPSRGQKSRYFEGQSKHSG